MESSYNEGKVLDNSASKGFVRDLSDYGQLQVGQDLPQHPAGKVRVMGFRVQPYVKEGKEFSKLVLVCKHADGGIVEVSKGKFELKGRLQEGTFWLQKDTSGKLKHRSFIGLLLASQKVETINELADKELDTVVGNDNYLLIKGY